MKKGKIITKGQITVAVMLVALGAAIWLNSKYLPSDAKYLGDTKLVNASQSGSAVATSAKVSESGKEDYFASSIKERKETREEAVKQIEEVLDNKKLTDADKKSALAKIEEITARMEAESNVETLLKAKGFQKCVAVMNDTGITAVVSSDGLTSQQTLQIQDVITAETGISLENIKILPVK